MGFHAGSMADSSTYQAQLSQLVMKEYVTFPIFLTSKNFSEVRLDDFCILKGAGCTQEVLYFLRKCKTYLYL